MEKYIFYKNCHKKHDKLINKYRKDILMGYIRHYRFDYSREIIFADSNNLNVYENLFYKKICTISCHDLHESCLKIAKKENITLDELLIILNISFEL